MPMIRSGVRAGAGSLWRAVLCALGLGAALPAAHAAEFDCLMQPKREVTISGSIEALITNVRVDRGDFVKKGDVIVEFESGVERASAELARFRSEMDSEVEARRARQVYAQARHNRGMELVKKNFISSQELEEIVAERRLADAELREAQDSRRLAELEYKRATEVVRLRSLRSPVSGVVVDRYMHPGEISEVGAKPILKLAEISTLHVEVILPTSAYGQIAMGDVATVRPESPVGGSYPAKVVVVDRVLDSASGTFGVRLELPNEKSALPAGARCQVEFSKVKGPAVRSSAATARPVTPTPTPAARPATTPVPASPAERKPAGSR
jgi:RND family efflux transporter MFP subunit